MLNHLWVVTSGKGIHLVLIDGDITLFKAIIVFCGTDSIMWNIFHIQCDREEYSTKKLSLR